MGQDEEAPGEWLALAPGVLGRPGARAAGWAPARRTVSTGASRTDPPPIWGRLLGAAALLGGILGLVVVASGHPTSANVESVLGAAATDQTAPPATATAGSSDLASIDWWGVLAELDRRRADALQHGDAAVLDRYAVRDSPAWRGDAALVASLSAAGVRPVGLSAAVLAIEEVTRCGDDACLVVVDRRSAYTMADARGDTVDAVPAAAAGRWRITLASVAAGIVVEPTDPGWRVRQVEAMP